MIRDDTAPPDILTLARTLRAPDREELFLGTGQPEPVDSLRDAVSASDICETLRFNDGELAAIWGVVALPAATGSIWMICSDAVEWRPSQFLRACPGLVQYAHAKYPTLLCAPWRGNALHLRWLEWLGFTPGAVHGQFQLYSHVRTTPSSNPDAGSLSGWRCDGSELGKQRCRGSSKGAGK